MSKRTDAYREHTKVYNSHEFAGKGNPYISYRAANPGRGGHGAAWQVVRPGYRTDPKGHWMDGGHKTFHLFGSGKHADLKARVLAEAQEWVGARYGITEWARTPFGDWMDAGFVTARVAELDAMVDAAGGVGKQRPLKVWSLLDVGRRGDPKDPKRPWVRQVHVIVATPSRKAAADAFGVSSATLASQGGVTGNDRDVAIATSEPGTVFVTLLDSREAPVRRVYQGDR